MSQQNRVAPVCLYMSRARPTRGNTKEMRERFGGGIRNPSSAFPLMSLLCGWVGGHLVLDFGDDHDLVPRAERFVHRSDVRRLADEGGEHRPKAPSLLKLPRASLIAPQESPPPE